MLSKSINRNTINMRRIDAKYFYIIICFLLLSLGVYSQRIEFNFYYLGKLVNKNQYEISFSVYDSINCSYVNCKFQDIEKWKIQMPPYLQSSVYFCIVRYKGRSYAFQIMKLLTEMDYQIDLIIPTKSEILDLNDKRFTNKDKVKKVLYRPRHGEVFYEYTIDE